MKIPIVISLICVLIQSCTTRANRVEIPKNACIPPKIEIVFDNKKDLDSILKNIQYSRLYMIEYQKEVNLSVQCFQNIIAEMQK
jgi:hypothetical protein